ncbi:hypothetical protein [Photobacterium sp. GSS17]|uniref:hypothetical protein n=1 Tax=Photobacterium sp. GSS17 TaxID=3020715 RepID=UPI0023606D28|nr:hypothetical protein [Photobacterium sp. GSS17]
MASSTLSKLSIILPPSLKPKGSALPPTYNPEQSKEVLTFPNYEEHKQDLFNLRQEKNSQELISEIFSQDPDLANTVWSFLTVANVEPMILARDVDDQLDKDAVLLAKQVLAGLTVQNDYSQGFVRRKTLRKYAEEMRYMLLLRGSLGVEAIYDEFTMLSDLRHVDMYTVRWYEKQAGVMKPVQQSPDGKEIKLDIPTFFVEDLYKNPTEAYARSPFTTAINTIAATQQVINDLYRIMQVTGFPRMSVKVLEEVLLKHAPNDVKADAMKQQNYVRTALSMLTSQFSNLRPDLPAVHLDSVELTTINDRAPGMSVDISHVIKVLDAQKQSGLHTLSTILGRGESGVNTATVEARLFTMSADALNAPIADVLSAILTQAIRIMGSQSRITVIFPEPELRSDDEREAQKVLKQQRLHKDLSLGVITDDEYHLQMYGRLPPQGFTPLSGTLFEQGGMQVDASKVSPNTDPLGRSVSQASDKQVKSNSVSSSKKSRQKS